MAAAERGRIAAAARLRRTGPRTFQRPPRTLSSTLCRGQYSGLQSDYFGAVLSPAPPANETRFHQTARDHDAKEFVALNLRRRPRKNLPVESSRKFSVLPKLDRPTK